MLSLARKTIVVALPWLVVWRWHRASVVMALLVASVMLLLNSIRHGALYSRVGNFYGWPREFIFGYPHGGQGRFVFSLIKGTVLEFDMARLAFNASVAAAMTAGVGLAFEYRHRSGHKKAWQFSVKELLVAALVVAMVLCWLVRRNIREEAALRRLHCNFVACSIIPDAVRHFLPNMPGGWLKPLDYVTSLHIMASERADDYFMALDQFPEVKEVEVEADFGDGALIHIARMRGLRHLSLESPQLSGEGLEALASLPRLRHLQLRLPLLSDEGLRQLSRFTRVEIDLDLRGAAITAAQWRALAKIAGLRHLTLGDRCLDDKMLSTLSQMTQLRHLTLDFANQRGESLIRPAQLRHLTYLELHNIPPSSYRVIDDFRRDLPGCTIYVH